MPAALMLVFGACMFNRTRRSKNAIVYPDRLGPMRALIISFGLWLAVFVVAPVDPRWSEVPTGYFLLLFGLLGLMLGFVLPKKIGTMPKKVWVSENVIRAAILICIILGLIGFVFKTYDYLALRGVNLSGNAIETRQLLRRSDTNLVSILAAALLPFSVAGLSMSWFGYRAGIVKRIGVLAWIGAALPAVANLLLVSRSASAMLISIVIVLYFNLAPTIKVKAIVVGGAMASVFTSLFALVFLSRVEEAGMDMLWSIHYSAFTEVVPLKPWAIQVINHSGESGKLLAAYASLIQYWLHGVFEFFYLVDLKQGDFAYGSYTFFFIPKLYVWASGGSITVFNATAEELVNPRAGVFQSFFGPLYIDFGFLFPLACLLFGFLTGYLRRCVRSGNIFAFPVYIYMVSQILLAACLPSLFINAAIIGNVMLTALFLIGQLFLRRSVSTKSPNAGGT
jgi:hypothetical protein